MWSRRDGRGPWRLEREFLNQSLNQACKRQVAPPIPVIVLQHARPNACNWLLDRDGAERMASLAALRAIGDINEHWEKRFEREDAGPGEIAGLIAVNLPT